MTDRYDVIVIGTGAGGGTLAHTLATAGGSGGSSPRASTGGKKILLLERGDFLPPQVHYFVGGATKMYGAAMYRYSEFKTILNTTGLAAHHVLRKNFYMDMKDPDRRSGAPGRYVSFRN